MGTNDIAFDASTARIRISTSALGGITKLGFPEEKIKNEKIATIGQQYATIRTDGIVEVGDGEIEMTTVGWAAWLAVLPSVIGSIEFPITVGEVHPQVTGPYSVIWDRCKILGTKQEIDNSEKAHRVTIPISVILLLHKGQDGQYKTLARRPGTRLPISVAAISLMF